MSTRMVCAIAFLNNYHLSLCLLMYVIELCDEPSAKRRRYEVKVQKYFLESSCRLRLI